jgi:hypothetical protein
MSNEKIFPTHNTLTFTGRKLTPFFAKLINDTMYERTGLDGAYLYDVSGVNTIFTIYPESFEFGYDAKELETHMTNYKKIYEHVVSLHPESLVY